MEFSGRLATVSLHDLLQWAHNDTRTGCLVVRTSQRQKRIFFDRGHIVGCYTDDPSEYFGQFLLLRGYLDHDQLREALSHCREAGTRLGEGLVELGILSADAVQEALRGQIEDAVCDLFLWEGGVFYFETSMPAREQLLPKPINTIAVALEGQRWVDELERMKGVFVHDNILLCRGPEWDAGPQAPVEERVVERFADLLSLSDLYHRVQGNHFRFLEAVFKLTVRGVLDIDSVGEETTNRSSREIRIVDLLMEQAAREEQAVFSERHLSLPLEVVHRFYPLWVEPEPGDGGDDVAPPTSDELAFFRSMDGSRSMHDLVVVDTEHRERKMELILVELRRGNVALLPRPVDEFERRSKADGGWLKRLFA